MKHRSAALALAVALVLPVAGATVASAATLTHSAAGKSDHDKHSEDAKPGKDKREKVKNVVYAGTVSAVDADAATLTFTVRGGRDKKLRNTSLTLSVPAGATIIRDGQSSTLAEIQAGDRVSVHTRQTTSATVVTRIIARDTTATAPETEPTTPAPTPTA